MNYWYHVLHRSIDEQTRISTLAKFVERVKRVRSEVTVELFFSEQTEFDVATADKIARGIESSLTKLFPPNPLRGSRRHPSLMVTDTGVLDAE